MEEYFKKLTILWASIMLAPVMFMVVALVAIPEPLSPELKGQLDWVMLIGLIGSIPLSKLVFDNLLAKSKDASIMVEEKQRSYQQAILIQMAILEAGCMFGLVGYILTHSVWLLPFVLGGIVWMFLQRPSLQKFRETMNLIE